MGAGGIASNQSILHRAERDARFRTDHSHETGNGEDEDGGGDGIFNGEQNAGQCEDAQNGSRYYEDYMRKKIWPD